MISRYWTLIGNVQPGVMKDSWLHEGERVESVDSLTFILDPDMTCVQRYENMVPILPTASQKDAGDQLVGFGFNEVKEATESITEFGEL